MPTAPCFTTLPAQLRRTSWRQLALYAFLTLFALMLVRLMLPAEMRPALRKFDLVLPLLLLAAKDLAHWPDALRRLRAASGWPGRITALLPPELVGMFRLDRLMWRGSRSGYCAVLRRRLCLTGSR